MHGTQYASLTACQGINFTRFKAAQTAFGITCPRQASTHLESAIDEHMDAQRGHGGRPLTREQGAEQVMALTLLSAHYSTEGDGLRALLAQITRVFAPGMARYRLGAAG